MLLLDLNLPDSPADRTLSKLKSLGGKVPVVVLTEQADETTAVDAVKNGAQDYVFKSNLDGASLALTARYAIERHKIRSDLESLARTDELTGLFTRQEFLSLAGQQLKISNRTKRGMVLLVIHFRNLPLIRKAQGAQEGEWAQKKAADIITETFRESDIIGLLSAEEFVVLAIEIPGEKTHEILLNRLKANTRKASSKSNKPYNISFTVGAEPYNPEAPCPSDELITEAQNEVLLLNLSQQN